MDIPKRGEVRQYAVRKLAISFLGLILPLEACSTPEDQATPQTTTTSTTLEIRKPGVPGVAQSRVSWSGSAAVNCHALIPQLNNDGKVIDLEQIREGKNGIPDATAQTYRPLEDPLRESVMAGEAKTHHVDDTYEFTAHSWLVWQSIDMEQFFVEEVTGPLEPDRIHGPGFDLSTVQIDTLTTEEAMSSEHSYQKWGMQLVLQYFDESFSQGDRIQPALLRVSVSCIPPEATASQSQLAGFSYGPPGA